MSLVASDAPAQDTSSRFRDPDDGAFDISAWLAGRTGVVPIAMPITEPALDYGAALGLVWFHPKNVAPGQRPLPPDLTVGAGFYTGSKSWGAFGGHIGYWKQDRIRYNGGIGYVSLNLDYFGIGGTLENPIHYNVTIRPLVQQLSLRVPRTNLFLGGRYVYMQNTVDVDVPIDLPSGDPAARTTSLGALGPLLTFDTRDNTFTPNKGLRVEASNLWYDPAFGGDFTYRYGRTVALGWVPLGSRLVGGLRADVRAVHGDVPFYALPYVDLRGVPAARYQNDAVLVFETEERWRVYERWSLVGFGGVGTTGSSLKALDWGSPAWNAGLGGRYLIARKFGLHMGLDVARGPEDWAFYVVFGNMWR